MFMFSKKEAWDMIKFRVLLTVLVGVAFLAGVFLMVGATPRAQAQSGAPRWEYRCVRTADFPAKLEPKFNKLGDEGWEMAGCDAAMACFKRRK